MAVRIRPRSGPINRLLIGAAAALGLAWNIWPGEGANWQDISLPSALAAGGAIFVVTAAGRLVRDYQLRRNIAISEEVTKDHGSARFSTWKEIVAAGMDKGQGDLLGLDPKGRAIWRPNQFPFSLIEAPPGAGKSVCYVLPWIITRAIAKYSLVIADPKCELYHMLAPALRERGFEVWACNPAGGTLDVPDAVLLNPYQACIDAMHAQGDERKDAIKIASDYAVIHYPLDGDEKNPYFANGSRRVLVVAIASEALLNPAGCTPTKIYSLITNPFLFLKRLRLLAKDVETLNPDDPVIAFLRGEALNLLHRAKENEENFASFLEGASQRLLSFNPAGHLGSYGEGAYRRVRELRERQVILFIMSPLSHMREFAGFISLLNHNILAAAKATPSGHLVHLVAEEALNYRFAELTSDMETLRGLGVSADFFIQGFAGLEKAYGKDNARSIESYADVRIYMGLNSYERSKFVSDNLSDETLRKQDFSYDALADKVHVSSKEVGRPLLKPNEVQSLTRGEALVFVSGMSPVKVRTVHYGEVDWWRDAIRPSPITGTRLYGPPVLTVPPFEKVTCDA